MFVYPDLDPDDNLQRRPAPELIFMVTFGVSQVSRDRFDRKKSAREISRLFDPESNPLTDQPAKRSCSSE